MAGCEEPAEDCNGASLCWWSYLTLVQQDGIESLRPLQ
jgi:hypothetical protein